MNYVLYWKIFRDATDHVLRPWLNVVETAIKPFPDLENFPKQRLAQKVPTGYSH